MSEMVERVAKAKWARRQQAAGIAGIQLDNWEDETEALREEVRAETRCGMAEMREATQQMRLAGIAEWARPDPTPEHESTLVFNAIWRAMIDAARDSEKVTA